MKIFFTLLFSSLLMHGGVHPLHVATTDISYNAGDKKLEVVCTLFYDDFEEVLSRSFKGRADLSAEAQHHKMDNWVKRYVLAHVQVMPSGKTINLNYVGFEKVREVVNVYFETEPVSPPKMLRANVSLLHDLFNDQMNIVHMTVNGVRKSTKLDYPDKQATQTF
ncbi:MAG: hypothetical protein INR69_10840 [Mucilaginibacter polytrichastri]|nr:hypothetical protein [Mucilaginibacter polytrichastri]